MSQVVIWRHDGEGVNQLAIDDISERDLENLIEASPSLLEPNLTVVQRQFVVSGGRIDLVAVDATGAIKVIEIKRGRLTPEVIGQAAHYLTVLETMEFSVLNDAINAYLSRKRGACSLVSIVGADRLEEMKTERKLEVILVGTSAMEGVREIIDRRMKNPHQISVAVLKVYRDAVGGRIFVRESYPFSRTEVMTPRNGTGPRSVKQIPDLKEMAKANGVGQEFERFVELGEECGLYPRCWGSSLMFTPQEHRTRMIFTAWVKPSNGRLKIYVSPEAAGEFGMVSCVEAEAAIGKSGYREVDLAQLNAIGGHYKNWFAHE